MNRKKIVIPILIIFILVVNILVSTVYKGFMSFAVDTKEESNVNVDVNSDDINNIKIIMGGNFESNIVSIKYTDGGHVSKDEVIDYFNNSSNHIVDITNQNQGVSSNVLAITIENAIQGKDYTILVVFEDGSAYIGYATIGKRTSGKMSIGYEYKSENQTLTIKATSDPNNIVLLKIAKSSEISQISDFDTKGEIIQITPSTDVTATYKVKEEGIYKLYTKDSEGHSEMEETKYLSQSSEKQIKITHKKGNNNALIIKAEDSAHKITEMKIMTSNSEVSKEDIEKNGIPVNISAGTKVQGEYTISSDNTYVTVYVKDEYGYVRQLGQTINSIEEDSTIVVPVEPDQEPDQKPDQTPNPTPDQKPDQTPNPTPDQKPDQTPNPTPDQKPDQTPNPTPDQKPDQTPNSTPDQKPNQTPDSSQGGLVVPMPDNNNDISGNENKGVNNTGNINTDNNDINNKNQNSSGSNSTNIQTNIKSNEQINNSSNKSLPKTGVEDTGSILLIVTLAGIAIISFIKFIRIK